MSTASATPEVARLPQVELPSGTLVIGDLHLDLAREKEVQAFLGWLRREAAAPHLIILGDLFEFWVGAEQADCPQGRLLLEALSQRVEAGTAIDVIPGNRDFLLDRDFELASGCRVRPAGLVGRLDGGARVLFLHGDELSTRDHGYQRLRRVLRSGAVTWTARHAPSALKRLVARRLRRASSRALQGKQSPQVAMQLDAGRLFCERHDAQFLACGHAHRFRDEDLGQGRRWFVVDHFGGERDTLAVGPAGSFGPRSSR